MTWPAAGLVTALIVLSVATSAAEEVLEGTVDDIADSPVFFEIHSKAYSDFVNVDLFREGKVRLHPLGIHSIEGFNWKTHERKDQSFWIRMERFDYMCPIFDSTTDLDRDIARAWVTNWLDVHEVDPHPNVGSRDAMGIGMRGMMLARYLRYLLLEEPEQKDLIARLYKSMEWHQEFLKDPLQFNAVSNHGLWEAAGLFETTRAVPNPDLTLLALERFQTVINTGVSPIGVEREHAAGYHFYFYKWVREFAEYVASLDHLEWDGEQKLQESSEKMGRATWYLYDHAGRIPQIGDTDDVTPEELLVPVPHFPKRKEPESSLFDPVSGFAVYKDRTESKRRRYIVFSIKTTGHRTPMPYHVHNDVMSVYYSDDGEIILGDAGRYSYQNSHFRRFCRSSAGHNVIVQENQLRAFHTGNAMGTTTWQESDDDEVSFGLKVYKDTVQRIVTIPTDSKGFRVSDTITRGNPRQGTGGKRLLLWNMGMDVTGFGMGVPERNDSTRVYPFHIRTRNGHEFQLSITIRGAQELPGEIQVLKGSENPFVGWYSPDYNVKWPVPVILLTIPAPRQPIEITTAIGPR